MTRLTAAVTKQLLSTALAHLCHYIPDLSVGMSPFIVDLSPLQGSNAIYNSMLQTSLLGNSIYIYHWGIHITP